MRNRTALKILRKTFFISLAVNRSHRFFAYLLLITTIVLGSVTGVHAKTDDELYQTALAQAKDGQFDSALSLLEQLVMSHPENVRYFYDYLAVLGWAEQDQKAIELGEKVNTEQAPPYILEALGKSARHIKQPELAVRYYRLAVLKAPQRLDANLGLSYALLEAGQGEEALQRLEALAEQYPQNPSVQDALAYAYRITQNHFLALTRYQSLLESDPHNKQLQRAYINLVSLLGAPHLAEELSVKYPDALTLQDQNMIARDQAAMHLRWSDFYFPSYTHRMQEIDKAILILEQQVRVLQQRGVAYQLELHRAYFDLIVAYELKGEFEKTITLYESLEQDGVAFPDYALRSVANAYLKEHRPSKASTIYQDILSRQPENFDINISLFYALMDMEEYDKAVALIDRLAQEEPEWIISKANSTRRQPNDKKVIADSAAALARIWIGNLHDAQQRFERLVSQAPQNAGLRSELGFLYLARGWPEKALTEFELALGIAPDLLNAQIGKAESLQRLRAYWHAERDVEAIQSQWPGQHQSEEQVKRWRIHNLRQLRVEVSRAISSDGPVGSRDLALDAYLYSQPIYYNYRVFAHGHYAKSRFEEGEDSYSRYGVGVEHRMRDWLTTLELNAGKDDYDDTGISLDALWTPTDHWRLGVHYDSYSNDIPLRGRFNEGVKGWSAEVDLEYRFHESKTVSAAMQRIDMDDSNTRDIVSAAYQQRLISWPTYKLTGALSLAQQTNTRTGASYFNPEESFSTVINLVNEWRLLKKEDRMFFHRLGFYVGSYKQKDFSSGDLWGVSYEHHWYLDDRLELLYGVSYSGHPYDGEMEKTTRLYATLDWRF